MINFDVLSLKAFISEYASVLEDGRVQKVQQPSRREMLLNIRAQGKNHKLYINIDPKYPHLCVLSEKGEQQRNISIPQKPPMFCMLVRKHMEGARIKKITQPNYERILEIYFEGYSEIGERVPLVLAAEIMGKNSNIILYNYDTNVILGCAHNIGEEKSREREVSGGLPYIYPPKQKKIDLLSITKGEFYSQTSFTTDTLDKVLNEKFYGFSLALSRQLCDKAGISIEPNTVIATTQEKIYALYDLCVDILSFKNLKPAVSEDFESFSLTGFDGKAISFSSANAMIDAYFGHHVLEDIVKRQKSSFLNLIKKELKKVQNKLDAHTKKINTEEKAEKYREIADIIMANLYSIDEGAKTATLINPYTGMPEEIALEETLSPNANAQRYYKLYNKIKTAAKISKEISENLNEEKKYIESIKLSIEQTLELDELAQIEQELVDQSLMKQKNGQRKEKKQKYDLLFEKIGDFEIYLGKNNNQNDYIVSKLSRSDDLWLHVQNVAASHVLIKVPPQKIDVPDEILLKAAQIAVQHSQAKGSTKVPVICTRRKNLKKPPKAKPGYVIYKNEQIIFV